MAESLDAPRAAKMVGRWAQLTVLEQAALMAVKTVDKTAASMAGMMAVSSACR